MFASTDARLLYLRWLDHHRATACQRRKPESEVRRDFCRRCRYEAKRSGLDVSLVLGLIQVESGISQVRRLCCRWARGLYAGDAVLDRVIGDGDPGKLFHMQTNLRFGCVILRHYLDRERGDLYMALSAAYNGSRGKAHIPRAVFGAQRS